MFLIFVGMVLSGSYNLVRSMLKMLITSHTLARRTFLGGSAQGGFFTARRASLPDVHPPFHSLP